MRIVSFVGFYRNPSRIFLKNVWSVCVNNVATPEVHDNEDLEIKRQREMGTICIICSHFPSTHLNVTS